VIECCVGEVLLVSFVSLWVLSLRIKAIQMGFGCYKYFLEDFLSIFWVIFNQRFSDLSG
jgi:hypothetical protein